MNNKLRVILVELKSHAPFTLFGALTGIICMFVFKNVGEATTHRLFYVFHPAHILLSAITTTAMYVIYKKKKFILAVLAVGVVGSIGVATLSDSIIPYIGEGLLGMRVSVHGHGADVTHQDQGQQGVEAGDVHGEHEGFAERAHIGFIEAWYFVIPVAIVGVFIGYLRPKTRISHAGHVLLSTWASTFHIIMAMGGHLTIMQAIGSFGFLFLAVWAPCCISDIIFPLLFVKSGDVATCCHHH